MAPSEKITPAEWELMQAVWTLDPPASVRDVLDHLYPNGEKAYTTVQTLMNILEKKKLLTRRKIGMVNFYTPVRGREETTRNEMSTLVDRVFSGSIPALANSLLSLEDIGQDDLDEIRSLLAQRERQLKGDDDGHPSE